MTKFQPTRRRVLTALTVLPLGAVALRPAMAAPPAIYAEDGIAWDGHDPVGFFTQAAPTPGSAEFSLDYEGAKVLFASAENLDMFKADPMAYAPQFGGYCAFALSKGYIAPTVPEAWTVYEGKLYLNFSLRVRKLWSKDIPGNIAKGNANWPGVLEA